MIKISKDKKGQYFLTVKGGNRQPLSHTEGLKTRNSLLKNLIAQKRAWMEEDIVDTTGEFIQFRQLTPKKKKAKK